MRGVSKALKRQKEGVKRNMKKLKLWLRAAGMRAIKTVAQTALATLGTSMLISEVDWLMLLSASALSGILSLLTSIAGLPELKADTVKDDEDN